MEKCNLTSTRYTRHGKELVVVERVQDSFPHEFIDGEFWYLFYFYFQIFFK